jgi:hypothetical protein
MFILQLNSRPFTANVTPCNLAVVVMLEIKVQPIPSFSRVQNIPGTKATLLFAPWAEFFGI